MGALASRPSASPTLPAPYISRKAVQVGSKRKRDDLEASTDDETSSCSFHQQQHQQPNKGHGDTPTRSNKKLKRSHYLTNLCRKIFFQKKRNIPKPMLIMLLFVIKTLPARSSSRASAWKAIMNRLITNPEDARHNLTGGDASKKEKMTILQYLMCRYEEDFEDMPLGVAIELMKAYPGAVSVQQPSNGATPLHAALGGVLWSETHSVGGTVVRKLMQRMITPSASIIMEATGLPYDVVKRHVVPFLGDPLTFEDGEGCTLIHALLVQDKLPIDMIKTMIVAVPKVTSHVFRGDAMELGFSNFTPLHLACVRGVHIESSYEVIKLLVQTFPEALEMKDSKGLTPLHRCCYSKNASVDVIDLLSSKYPDALSLRDDDFCTPLMSGVLAGASMEVIQYLARACPESLHMRESHGRLPLHAACASTASSYSVFRHIVESFPDGVTSPDAMGCLPLHYACVKSRPIEMIVSLVRYNADALNTADQNGLTPIDLIPPDRRDIMCVVELSRWGLLEIFS